MKEIYKAGFQVLRHAARCFWDLLDLYDFNPACPRLYPKAIYQVLIGVSKASSYWQAREGQQGEYLGLPLRLSPIQKSLALN